METFSGLRWNRECGEDNYTTASSLHENKDSRINRLNITEDEKEELKQFFRKHPEKESAIDWNRRDLTYEDFKGLLSIASKSEVKRQIKSGKTKGLGLLVKDRDYEIVNQVGAVTLYKILNYEAMCVIASNDVAPALTLAIPEWARRSENEWYQYYLAHQEEMDQVAIADGATINSYGKYTPYAPGAHWCVAMKNTRSFWQDYHEDRGLNFYVLCDASRTDEFGKICIYREGEETSAWSACDTEFSLDSLTYSSAAMSDDAKEAVEDVEFETPKEPEELQNAMKEFYHLTYDINYWKQYEIEDVYGDHLLTFEMSGDIDPFGGYEQQLTLTLKDLDEDFEDQWEDLVKPLKGNDFIWDCNFDGEEAYIELRIKPSDKKEKILKVLARIDRAFKTVVTLKPEE